MIIRRPDPQRFSNLLYAPSIMTTTTRHLQRLRQPLLLLAVSIVCLSNTAMAQSSSEICKYEYDAMGNVTKITNPNNTGKVLSYDALGRLVAELDSNNKTTAYAYDGQSRLIKVTDARNLSTLYTLDGLVIQSPITGSRSLAKP